MSASIGSANSIIPPIVHQPLQSQSAQPKATANSPVVDHSDGRIINLLRDTVPALITRKADRLQQTKSNHAPSKPSRRNRTTLIRTVLASQALAQPVPSSKDFSSSTELSGQEPATPLTLEPSAWSAASTNPMRLQHSITTSFNTDHARSGDDEASTRMRYSRSLLTSEFQSLSLQSPQNGNLSAQSSAQNRSPSPIQFRPLKVPVHLSPQLKVPPHLSPKLKVPSHLSPNTRWSYQSPQRQQPSTPISLTASPSSQAQRDTSPMFTPSVVHTPPGGLSNQRREMMRNIQLAARGTKRAE